MFTLHSGLMKTPDFYRFHDFMIRFSTTDKEKLRGYIITKKEEITKSGCKLQVKRPLVDK